MSDGTHRLKRFDPQRAIHASLFIFAGAALITGAFMPWVELTAPVVGTVTFSGMDSLRAYGIIEGSVGGCLILLGLVFRNRGRSRLWWLAGATVLSGAAGAVSVYLCVRISQGIDQLDGLIPSVGNLGLGAVIDTSLGPGLFVLVAAAALGMGTCLYLALRPRWARASG